MAITTSWKFSWRRTNKNLRFQGYAGSYVKFKGIYMYKRLVPTVKSIDSTSNCLFTSAVVAVSALHNYDSELNSLKMYPSHPASTRPLLHVRTGTCLLPCWIRHTVELCTKVSHVLFILCWFRFEEYVILEEVVFVLNLTRKIRAMNLSSRWFCYKS